MKIKVAKTRFTRLCFKELLVRQSLIFIVQDIHFFSIGNSRLNCQIIESIFDMSLVNLHTCVLVQSFMSQESAASNSAISNFCLVTLKICYFEFHYLEFSTKIMNLLLWTLRKIFQIFDDFSWKIRENKGWLSTNFVCITFAQYCTVL